MQQRNMVDHGRPGKEGKRWRRFSDVALRKLVGDGILLIEAPCLLFALLNRLCVLVTASNIFRAFSLNSDFGFENIIGRFISGS